MAALSLVLAFAPPAMAIKTGDCDYGGQGNWHIILKRASSEVGGAKFIGARGKATVRSLGTCNNTLLSHGLSAVLPANIQFTNGEISQLGYAYLGDIGGPYFVYAHGSTQVKLWPGSWEPIKGQEYRFTIERISWSGGYTTVYTIRNVMGQTEQSISRSGWLGTSELAWWGYEQQNKMSYMGVRLATQYDVPLPIGLTDINYKATNSSSWVKPNIYGMYMGDPENPDHYFYGIHRCGYRSGSGDSSYFNAYTYLNGYNCTSG